MQAQPQNASILARLKGKLLIGIALGGLVFVGFSLYSGKDDLVSALGQVRWSIVGLLFVLAFMNYIIRFFKWDFYLHRLGISPSRKDSMIIFFSGLVMVITPGKVGELLKSYLLRKCNGTPISKSAPAVVAERLTDFIALLILCMLGIGIHTFQEEKYILIAAVCAISAFIGIIAWRSLSMKIIGWLEKIRITKKIAGRIHTMYESIYTLISPGVLLWTTLLSVAAWFCECAGLWFCLTFFTEDPSILTATFIYALSTIIGVVSPGGLGPTELGMTIMLQNFFHVAKAQATAATFLIRIATLWFAVLLGAVVLSVFQGRFEGVTDMMDEDKV